MEVIQILSPSDLIFKCHITNKSYDEIVKDNDQLAMIYSGEGLAKWREEETNKLIVPQKITIRHIFVSVKLFMNSKDAVYKYIWDNNLYFEYINCIESTIPITKEYFFKNVDLKIIPIFDDKWNIFDLSFINTLGDIPYKLLNNVIDDYLNASNLKESSNNKNQISQYKFIVNKILLTCTKLFDHKIKNDKEWAEKFKTNYEKYTIDPLIRLPNNIPDNLIFLYQIISGLNCGFIEPMLSIHAEQFLNYVEEETARRNLSNEVKKLNYFEKNKILSEILNLEYINNNIKDFSFGLEQYFDDMTEHFNYDINNSTDDNKIKINDIFNNQNNETTKFIINSVPFLIDNKTYKSYSGLKRLASYINNFLYCDDEKRIQLIKNNKYLEVLFNDLITKKFLQKTIFALYFSNKEINIKIPEISEKLNNIAANIEKSE